MRGRKTEQPQDLLAQAFSALPSHAPARASLGCVHGEDICDPAHKVYSENYEEGPHGVI